MNKRTTY